MIYVRARDVRETIMRLGHDKGIVDILERICEENAGQRQSLMSMAELLTQVVDNIDRLSTVGDGMKVAIQELRRRDEQYRSIDGVGVSSSND